MCGCWLVLLNWSKKCFRKISSRAAALLTRLPCQHVLDQKPLRLTSGNDVCMGLESLLAWDGWGTGGSHPRGKVVPGCPAVLPWHCRAAAVQVLEKLCLGLPERGWLEHLPWGRMYVWGPLTQTAVS